MNYPCNFENCGRKFDKKEDYLDHYTRRHSFTVKIDQKKGEKFLAKIASENILNNLKPKQFPKRPFVSLKSSILPKQKSLHENEKDKEKPNSANINKNIEKANSTSYSNSNETENKNKNNLIENDEKNIENTTIYSLNCKEGNENNLEENQHNFEDIMRTSDPEDDKKEEINLKDILESRKKLTEKYILEKAGLYDKIELINMLVLRDENLYVFEDNENLHLNRFIALEFLCLSHNKIFNLYGISNCTNLVELNINFNQVEDLYPVTNCKNLQKLWASNNKISDIKCLNQLKNLRNVSLYKNKIKSLDDIISVFSQLPLIEELDLDRNPATNKFVYKYDILFSVKLRKLDGEIVNEIDYELAKTFKHEKMLKLKNFDDPDLQRPSTAPGKIRNHFMGNESNYADRFKNKISVLTHEANLKLNYIPETNEKYYEMEQELQVIKEERAQLRKEIEDLKNNEDELNLKIKQLETDLLIKKVEANSSYILMDENKELKNKLKVYEEAFKDENKPESVFIEKISILQLKIDYLMNENYNLKLLNENKTNDSECKMQNNSKIELKSQKSEYRRPNIVLQKKPENEIEKSFEKNSQNIEQIKEELRNMMESFKEKGVSKHDDSFSDNNLFDPEL